MTENIHMQTATWLVSREMAKAQGPGTLAFILIKTANTFVACFWHPKGPAYVPGNRDFLPN